jgi:hypothetical protein
VCSCYVCSTVLVCCIGFLQTCAVRIRYVYFYLTPTASDLEDLRRPQGSHRNLLNSVQPIFSPIGVCIFVSSLYTGGISGKEITKCSGTLELIEPGDSVMADNGFDIAYELFIPDCKLNIPPFMRGGQLSKTEVTKT